MTSEELALLKAIKADPDDDLPRLVYADWLDENAGEKCPQCDPAKVAYCTLCKWGRGWLPDARRPRADFIRVQIELAKIVSPGCTKPMRERRKPDRLYRGAAKMVPCGVCRWCELNRRQCELVEQDGAVVLETSHLRQGGPEDGTDRFAWGFVRGFVESCRMRLGDWFGGEVPTSPYRSDVTSPRRSVAALGPLIVAVHPVKMVQFTDRKPLRIHESTLSSRRLWTWWDVSAEMQPGNEDEDSEEEEDLSDLPSELFALIVPEVVNEHTWNPAGKRFATAENAQAAISAAALKWAEREARRKPAPSSPNCRCQLTPIAEPS